MNHRRFTATLALCSTLAPALSGHAQGRPTAVPVAGGPAPVQPAQPVQSAPTPVAPAQATPVPPGRGRARGNAVFVPTAPPSQPIGTRPRAVAVAPGTPPPPPVPPSPVLVAPPAQGRPSLPGPARVTIAPPPMRFETPSSNAPAPGYVWIPGYNHWNGNVSVWVPGHWEMPPQPGVLWIAPRWIQRGAYFEYYPGYWTMPQYVQSYAPDYGDRTLIIGSSVQGALQYGDRTTPSGALVNDYSVNLSPGQTVTIALHGGPSWTTPGTRLDPMVQVFENGSSVLLAQDDDSGGGQDSLLVFTPVRGGTYTLRVTTYGSGINQGYYTLNTRFGVQLAGM